MTNKYYVYAYLDPRKPGDFKYLGFTFSYEPFYIGKGEGRRIEIGKGRNVFCKRKINKINKELKAGPIVIKVKDNLSEDDAFTFEIELIKIIGRGYFGPLTNLTDGGEGMSGHIFSNESKEKMRQAQIGKKHTKETLEKMSQVQSGKIITEETKKKMREAHKNRKLISDETRAKMREVQKNRKPITDETRARISQAQKNRAPATEATKAKMKDAHKNRLPELEKARIEKIGEAHSGKGNGFYGKKHSKETRVKMSKAHEYRKPMTEETKIKIGRAQKGKSVSEEVRARMKQAQQNRRKIEKENNLQEAA